jgi:hypothetical protein
MRVTSQILVVDDPRKASLEHSFVRVKLFLALRLSGRPQGPADMASFKGCGGTFPSLAPILGIFVEAFSRESTNNATCLCYRRDQQSPLSFRGDTSRSLQPDGLKVASNLIRQGYGFPVSPREERWHRDKFPLANSGKP